MLYEWRSYELLAGKVDAYVRLLKDEGLPVVTKHLPLVGYWVTEAGLLNQLHHLWVYRDWEDRAARRVALGREAHWTQVFIPEAMSLVLRQRNSFMVSLALDEEIRGLAEPSTLLGSYTRGSEPAGSGLFELILAEQPPASAPMGSWRIVFGHRTGGYIGLRRWAGGQPATPPQDHDVEIIRAFDFSPLR